MSCVTNTQEKSPRSLKHASFSESSDGDAIFEDFQNIEAEIIDYGVCEDENEFEDSTKAKSTTYEMIDSSTNIDEHFKRLSVNIVDCKKYPLYYKINKNNTESRKLTDKHKTNAKSIITIDLTNSETDLTTQPIENKSNMEIKSILVKNKSKTNKTSDTIVDIKRNKGLVGMKVRRMADANIMIHVKHPSVKPKVIKRRQKRSVQTYVDAVEKRFEDIGTRMTPIYNKDHKIKQASSNNNEKKVTNVNLSNLKEPNQSQCKDKDLNNVLVDHCNKNGPQDLIPKLNDIIKYQTKQNHKTENKRLTNETDKALKVVLPVDKNDPMAQAKPTTKEVPNVINIHRSGSNLGSAMNKFTKKVFHIIKTNPKNRVTQDNKMMCVNNQSAKFLLEKSQKIIENQKYVQKNTNCQQSLPSKQMPMEPKILDSAIKKNMTLQKLHMNLIEISPGSDSNKKPYTVNSHFEKTNNTASLSDCSYIVQQHINIQNCPNQEKNNTTLANTFTKDSEHKLTENHTRAKQNKLSGKIISTNFLTPNTGIRYLTEQESYQEYNNVSKPKVTRFIKTMKRKQPLTMSTPTVNDFENSEKITANKIISKSIVSSKVEGNQSSVQNIIAEKDQHANKKHIEKTYYNINNVTFNTPQKRKDNKIEKMNIEEKKLKSTVDNIESHVSTVNSTLRPFGDTVRVPCTLQQTPSFNSLETIKQHIPCQQLPLKQMKIKHGSKHTIISNLSQTPKQNLQSDKMPLVEQYNHHNGIQDIPVFNMPQTPNLNVNYDKMSLTPNLIQCTTQQTPIMSKLLTVNQSVHSEKVPFMQKHIKYGIQHAPISNRPENEIVSREPQLPVTVKHIQHGSQQMSNLNTPANIFHSQELPRTQNCTQQGIQQSMYTPPATGQNVHHQLFPSMQNHVQQIPCMVTSHAANQSTSSKILPSPRNIQPIQRFDAPPNIRHHVPCLQVPHMQKHTYPSVNSIRLPVPQNPHPISANSNSEAGNLTVNNNFVTKDHVYMLLNNSKQPGGFMKSPPQFINACMPPRMNNVRPNMYWACNFPPPSTLQHPSIPPFVPPFPPPPFQDCQLRSNPNMSNSNDNKSIIGENQNGLVKKINISVTQANTPNNEIDTKEGIIIKTENNDEDKRITQSVSKEAADDTPILSKTEMIAILDQAISVESPHKLDLKRTSQPDIQANSSNKPKPGPLSKKLKFNDNHNTSPKTQISLPNKGYSPPILPIPTYQKILSEVSSHKIFPMCNLYKNKPKYVNTESDSMSFDQIKEDNYKKISLAEYKMRAIKFIEENA